MFRMTQAGAYNVGPVRETAMRTTRFLNLAGRALVGIAASFFAPRPPLYAQQGPPVTIDADDIGGVVSSSTGPEAGVWVIAETTELPTHYIKRSEERRVGK